MTKLNDKITFKHGSRFCRIIFVTENENGGRGACNKIIKKNKLSPNKMLNTQLNNKVLTFNNFIYDFGYQKLFNLPDSSNHDTRGKKLYLTYRTVPINSQLIYPLYPYPVGYLN